MGVEHKLGIDPNQHVKLGQFFDPLDRGFIQDVGEELDSYSKFLVDQNGKLLGEVMMTLVLPLYEIRERPSNARKVHLKFKEDGSPQFRLLTSTPYDRGLYEVNLNVYFDILPDLFENVGDGEATLMLGNRELKSKIIRDGESYVESDRHEEWIARDGKTFEIYTTTKDLIFGAIQVKIDKV